MKTHPRSFRKERGEQLMTPEEWFEQLSDEHKAIVIREIEALIASQSERQSLPCSQE